MIWAPHFAFVYKKNIFFLVTVQHRELALNFVIMNE